MVIKNELKLFDVVDKIGTENLLVQVAEECSELSKAALKLHRVATGTTPVSLEDAKENLIEEMADVLMYFNDFMAWGKQYHCRKYDNRDSYELVYLYDAGAHELNDDFYDLCYADYV